MVIFHNPIISYHHPINFLSIYADFSSLFCSWQLWLASQWNCTGSSEKVHGRGALVWWVHQGNKSYILIHAVYVIDLCLPCYQFFWWLSVNVWSHCFFKEVEEFRALSKEIVSLPAKAHFTMVHLDCEELKQGLANKAKNYAELLLKKLITSHHEQNLQLVTSCHIL